MLEGETPYTRWGDWPAWIALGATMIGLFVRRRPQGESAAPRRTAA